jgi:hypothetical protein
MYCSKCAAENPYDANFCYKCAFPITANFNTVSTARQVEPLGDTLNDEILTKVRNSERLPKSDLPAQKNNSQRQRTIADFIAGTILTVIMIFSVFGLLAAFLFSREVAPVSTNQNILGNGLLIAPVPVVLNTPKPKVKRTVEQQIIESANVANTSIPDNSVNYVGVRRCFLSNNGNTVYLRRNCDTRDCTNDESTIYSEAADGQEMYVANVPVIDSGIGFSWIPLEFDGSVSYAASLKLDCK